MKVDVVDSLLVPAGAKVRSPLEASFPNNTKTWCLIGCWWLGLVEINLSISALKVLVFLKVNGLSCWIGDWLCSTGISGE
jgi:hypothetical protein